MENKFLENCKEFCSSFFFGMKVNLMKVIDVEKLKISERLNPITNNIQFNASEILKETQK